MICVWTGDDVPDDLLPYVGDREGLVLVVIASPRHRDLAEWIVTNLRLGEDKSVVGEPVYPCEDCPQSCIGCKLGEIEWPFVVFMRRRYESAEVPR